MSEYEYSWNIKCLAGKTDPNNKELWLPLWMHLEDTAGIIERLVRRWLPESVWHSVGMDVEQLVAISCLLARVHDIGKATVLFQNRIMRELTESRERLLHTGLLLDLGSLDHDKTTHACASEVILRHKGCPGGLASIAGAHHGKTQEWANIDNQLETYWRNYWPKGQGQQWQSMWDEIFTTALRCSGFNKALDLPQLSVAAEVLLTGLLIMADWIASNTDYFPLISIEETGSCTWYPDRVGDAWERLHLTTPWEAQYSFLDDTTFCNRFGFAPNEVQHTMLDVAAGSIAPGIYILEAQMGVGKTEAALGAAEVLAAKIAAGGIYFGLPTQATANGIFERLRDWAESQSEDMDHSIRLAHGMAELNEDYRSLFSGSSCSDDEDIENGVFVHQWFQGSKQALLADFVIGTVDQLLMAALKQKHVMLRHLGLAGKIVIVDECHAYDAYMNQYLDRALSWLGKYHVPVILLSATLPVRRRKALIHAYLNDGTRDVGADCNSRAYPLLTWTDGTDIHEAPIRWERASRTVHLESITEEDISVLLMERMREGGCAGIIVNTVKKAQSIAEQLHESMPEYEIVVFHAQFIMPDRATRESVLAQRIGKRSTPPQRDRLIVIGTQVLEQSLDIDLDYLITELCPMDLLLQRIGRLHRHEREKRPMPVREAYCAVLDTGEDAFDAGSARIYSEWLLWRTRQLLPDRISLPSDIPVLVQSTYSWDEGEDILDAMQVVDAKTAYELAQGKQRQRASSYTIRMPEEHPRIPVLNTLDGWLSRDDAPTDTAARAAVRDGEGSIEVLIMIRHKDGTVHFLPWQEKGRAISADCMPSADDALAIARQRLRLPMYFSASWNVDSVIRELEDMNRRYLPMWQQAPMLRGELVLLLEENMSTHLAGCTVHYNQVHGLTYVKETVDAGN